MLRHVALATLVAASITASGVLSQAQYTYPPGYAGWSGFGAATPQSVAARGAGAFAAGAGAYNAQTAEARSVNAQTSMQISEYNYACQQRTNEEYYKKTAARSKAVNDTAQKTYQRLHDNPNSHDIHSGDALNVVLDELTNPKVYSIVLQRATQQIPSQLVKNVEYSYASQGIAISLDELSARGVPDVILTTPAYQPDRKAFRAIVDQAKQEASTKGQIEPETLAKGRAIIKGLQGKIDSSMPIGTPQRTQADNFLKALYGLTKMLETPNVSGFLRELDKIPTTTMAHLIGFMHTFNLRFGAAGNPMQQSTYDQLYPLLLALRDQALGRGDGTMPTAPTPDPQQAISYFSGMDMSHFGPQPPPHPAAAPPAAGLPK